MRVAVEGPFPRPLIRRQPPAVTITMSAKETARGAGQILLDLGPIIAFVGTFNIVNRSNPENAIYIATGVFMAATVLAAGVAWLRTRKVPPVLIVTLVLVLAFGGLTLALHDENLIKLKPTFVYLFYSAAIFGAMAFGQNVWKLLFSHAFTLPDRVWKTLAIRWGLFFIAMAGINEAIRLTQSTEFWVNSRLFIGFPLVALFMIINLPITLKNVGKLD
jgi:intracellular septation protein